MLGRYVVRTVRLTYEFTTPNEENNAKALANTTVQACHPPSGGSKTVTSVVYVTCDVVDSVAVLYAPRLALFMETSTAVASDDTVSILFIVPNPKKNGKKESNEVSERTDDLTLNKGHVKPTYIA